MATEPTTVEKIAGLRWSISSNVANTFFVQFTFFGSVFVLFLSELGLSKSQMGVLLSLLPFSGLLALFVAPAVARYGYKRTYLLFFGARNLPAAALLLTPLVNQHFGGQITLIYVGIMVAAFSLLRSIGVTASFPWVQEYVPNSMRGKYTATNNMFTTIAGFIAVSSAGFVLARLAGLSGFMLLIGIGVTTGFISVWLAAFIPGGAPSPDVAGEERPKRDLREALGDRDFMRYLLGVGLISLAIVPLGSFLPLYMRDQVGLLDSQVVWLQMGALLGSLSSSYLWGWAADRYGSKPVALIGIIMRLILPIFWIFMPQQSSISVYIALAIAFAQGVADLGWGIGSGRLLYVSIVPPEKKRDYMALYYAWIGIVGGVSQLIGGRILDLSQNIQGTFLYIPLSPYFPLFLLAMLLPVVTVLIMRTIRDDQTLSMGEFVGIFMRGNPFLAMSFMMRFHMAKDEETIVLLTERMAQTRSPLTVDELLEALKDPRFNVRFEAIVAIGRMRPEERLINALVEVLLSNQPALSVVAAWSLGRLGDDRALEPLRQGMHARYRSVQAHSVRALGTLGDESAVPVMLERLGEEDDEGLQVAYASSLGKMQVTAAIHPILTLLKQTEDEANRMELALALARMAGEEHHFINLARQIQADIGTVLSQEVTGLKRRLPGDDPTQEALRRQMDACAGAFSRNEMSGGIDQLCQLMQQMPESLLDPAQRTILDHCGQQIARYGLERQEYILLALHVLHTEQPSHGGERH